MKLTVDFALNPHLARHAVLTKLVSKAKISVPELPLEALLSEAFNLKPDPDYPLAAIAANADGVDLGQHYWMRADPVHLVLQRDSFSLAEPVPLAVSAEHASQLIATLNAHFASDGLAFFLGQSGAWYLRWQESPQIRTNLPSCAIGRDVHGFMPQGEYAGRWLSTVNEIQMLLFEHPVNQLREASGLPAINSIWISGGGTLPLAKRLDHTVALVADHPLYRGLAKWAGLTCLMPSNVAGLLKKSGPDIRLYLDAGANFDVSLGELLQALKERKVEQLILNIGSYDKCLVATLQPWDLYRFWRKQASLESLLS